MTAYETLQPVLALRGTNACAGDAGRTIADGLADEQRLQQILAILLDNAHTLRLSW